MSKGKCFKDHLYGHSSRKLRMHAFIYHLSKSLEKGRARQSSEPVKQAISTWISFINSHFKFLLGSHHLPRDPVYTLVSLMPAYPFPRNMPREYLSSWNTRWEGAFKFWHLSSQIKPSEKVMGPSAWDNFIFQEQRDTKVCFVIISTYIWVFNCWRNVEVCRELFLIHRHQNIFKYSRAWSALTLNQFCLDMGFLWSI